MNTILKANSILLGASILTFGILKFFDPFHSWYLAQVHGSGLPEFNVGLGIAGEIAAGVLLLGGVLRPGRLGARAVSVLLLLGSSSLVVMMGMAVYVHLQPGVPADVLPLKIKPPFIPAGFGVLAALNLLLALSAARKLERLEGDERPRLMRSRAR